jgi:hypothetical protein
MIYKAKQSQSPIRNLAQIKCDPYKIFKNQKSIFYHEYCCKAQKPSATHIRFSKLNRSIKYEKLYNKKKILNFHVINNQDIYLVKKKLHAYLLLNY